MLRRTLLKGFGAAMLTATNLWLMPDRSLKPARAFYDPKNVITIIEGKFQQAFVGVFDNIENVEKLTVDMGWVPTQRGVITQYQLKLKGKQ